MRRAIALVSAVLVWVFVTQSAITAAPPEVPGLSAVISRTMDRADRTMVRRVALVSSKTAVPRLSDSTEGTTTVTKPPNTPRTNVTSLLLTTTTSAVSASTFPPDPTPMTTTRPAPTPTTTPPPRPVAITSPATAATTTVPVPITTVAEQITTTASPASTTTIAPPAPPTPAASNSANFSAGAESDFVSRINGLRASVGLNGLVTNPVLMNYARWCAKQMAERGKVAHSNIGSLLLNPWSVVSENVAQGASTNSIFNALVASASHHPHMVDPAFTAVGVGAYLDSTGRLWTAHVFGG